MRKFFQTARLINAAVMANKVLKKAMFTNWYGLAQTKTWSRILKYFPMFSRADFGINAGYTIGGIVGDKRNDYGVPLTITEEFTSVYRLHSLLPEALELKRYSDKKAVTVPMEATRNEKSYDLMSNYDLKDLFYSFGTQHPGQLILGNNNF
jgi:hypothetical protein